MSYNAQNVYISKNVLQPKTSKMKRRAKLTKTQVATSIILTSGIMAANPNITAFAKEQAVTLVKEPSKVIPNVKTEVLSEMVKSPIVETVAPTFQENIVKNNPDVAKKIAKTIQESKEKSGEKVSKKVEKMVSSVVPSIEKPKEENKKEESKKQDVQAKSKEKKNEQPKTVEVSNGEKIVKEAYRMYETNGVNSSNRLHYSMPKRDVEGFGDCSKFTKDVYKTVMGMDIGYNTLEQITNAKDSFHFGNDKLSELQPGDIMYFNSPGGHELSGNVNGNKVSVDHTAIFVGDNKFIDMSASVDGISVKDFGSGAKYEQYVKSSFIGYIHFPSNEQKTTEQPKEEQNNLAFDPVKEYGSAFNFGDKPLLGTLTEKETKAIQNSMIRPVPRDTYSDVSSGFAPRNLNGKQEFHHGMDYPAEIGTPIYAAADGKVIYSGKAGGYGNWIVLEHNINGITLYTIYGHMKEEDLYVKEGDTVKQGQKISAVNEQGQATGAHLHFSVAKSRDEKSPRIFYNYINPTFTVDVGRSDSYTYEGHEAKKQEEKQEDNGVVDKEKYWKLALEASKQTGWHPLFIMSQWEIETTHFTSPNFRNNNNLAGQTWYPGSPFPKGTPRPKNEGGYYIKYPSPVEGYVDFIKRNPRYSHVKDLTTPEEQAHEVAQQGWAVGPEQYEQTLLALIKQNREKYGDVGIQKPDEEKAAETQPETPKAEQPEEKKEEVKQEDKKEEKKEESKQKPKDSPKEEKKETTENKDDSSKKSDDTKQPKEEQKKEDSSSKDKEKTSDSEKEKVEIKKEEKDTIPFIIEQIFGK